MLKRTTQLTSDPAKNRAWKQRSKPLSRKSAIPAPSRSRKAGTPIASNGGRIASEGIRQPRKPINRLGPKTEAWETARAWLKIQFAKAGITTCQLRYAGCKFDDWLSFAHPAKRDRLRPGELYVVALACTVCHDAIEFGPPEEMRRIVELHFHLTGIQIPKEFAK